MNLFKDQRGIAWIPIVLAVLIGAPIIIGGTVLISDNLSYRAARNKAQSQEAKQILKDQLNEFFNYYQRNCFSKVASVGSRQTYQKALDDVLLAYEEGRTGEAFAQYESEVIYTSQPVSQYDLSDSNKAVELRKTVWHELTHYLEVQNGDRRSLYYLNPSRDKVKSRNERHAEYMEHVLGIMQNLMRLEEDVKNNKVTGEQVKQKLAALKKQLDSGSANLYQAVPKDLEEFGRYSGFNVNWNKIVDYYKKGTCLKFPDGSFEDSEIFEDDFTDEAAVADKYVVWEATNATVGLVITTKKVYETEELASNYPGGGLDPNYLIEKKLVSGDQTFNTFAEAETWICSQFTEVWYAPLGIGWTASWQGRDVFLANTSCGK